MSQSVLAETSKTQDDFRSTLGKWMAVFGEAFGQEVSLERMRAYLMVLEDELSVDELNTACTRVFKICNFFPSPAEILNQKVSREKDRDQLEAEKAWDDLIAYDRRWGPDRIPEFSDGKFFKAPPLEPATEWAVRQVGGYGYIHDIPPDKVFWVRKSFIENYKRFQSTDGLKLTPGKAEATRLLKKFAPALVTRGEK